jgi:hypothetical protein
MSSVISPAVEITRNMITPPVPGGLSTSCGTVSVRCHTTIDRMLVAKKPDTTRETILVVIPGKWPADSEVPSLHSKVPYWR